MHIEDALIATATPAVLLNFKAIEDRDLKRIIVPLKRFFKHNPCFMDFTKEAVAEGLRREWLDTLDSDDKASLLSDFKLPPGVTEDGYVIFNAVMLANYTKTEHPDRETYVKNPYTRTGFKDEVGLDHPPLTHFQSKLYGYERIADHIKEILMSDEELINLLAKSEKDDTSACHLLTQDFMYCISYHLLASQNLSK